MIITNDVYWINCIILSGTICLIFYKLIKIIKEQMRENKFLNEENLKLRGTKND